jgi:hypothetical protein
MIRWDINQPTRDPNSHALYYTGTDKIFCITTHEKLLNVDTLLAYYLDSKGMSMREYERLSDEERHAILKIILENE